MEEVDAHRNSFAQYAKQYTQGLFHDANIAVADPLFDGRDRKLPQAVAKVHPNYQNPYVSAILIVIVSLIGCLGFQDARPVLTNLVNFGAMTGLLTVNNYIMIRQKSKQIFAHMILPLIGL